MHYQLLIRDAISDRTGVPVLNSTFEHASIIVQEMFSNAHEMRLLSSRLETACYARPALIEAARAFLSDPDHTLRILVEPELHGDTNRDWLKHPLVATFRDSKHPVEMRAVPSDWTNRYRFNFALMDDFGFRFETDRSEPAAVAAFLPANKPMQQVEHLKTLFDTLWGHSAKIDLSPK